MGSEMCIRDRPIRCVQHKLDGHVDIISKKCEREGCFTQPTFGTVYKNAVRCIEHKEIGDIDVYHKVCERNGCLNRAIFGKRTGEVLSCSLHKRKEYVDLCSRRCSSESCSIHDKYERKLANHINPETLKSDLCYKCHLVSCYKIE